MFLRKDVGAGYTRLAALRRQKWDVVIVDESHHREAKAAIKTLERYSTVEQMILLTATPFQLDPKELHALFGTLLEKRRGDQHKLLTRPPVPQFVRGLESFFKGVPSHSRGRRSPQRTTCVRLLLAVGCQPRDASTIRLTATAVYMFLTRHLIGGAKELQDMLGSLSVPSKDFEAWYLRRRMELASCQGTERTFVPNKLRRALSTAAEARASLGNSTAPGLPFTRRLNPSSTGRESRSHTISGVLPRTGGPARRLCSPAS